MLLYSSYNTHGGDVSSQEFLQQGMHTGKMVDVLGVASWLEALENTWTWDPPASALWVLGFLGYVTTLRCPSYMQASGLPTEPEPQLDSQTFSCLIKFGL